MVIMKIKRETFIHFSKEKFIFDPKFKYAERCDGLKPDGLWISDESDFGWKQWCEEEGFNLKNLKQRTEITIDCEDVLWAKTIGELYRFVDEFGADSRFVSYSIRWDKVKEKYKGIIISPYQESLRLGNYFFWYYGWDCASGCVWDLSCIKDVRE